MFAGIINTSTVLTWAVINLRSVRSRSIISNAFTEQVSQGFFSDFHGFLEIFRARRLQYNMFMHRVRLRHVGQVFICT